MEIDGFPIDKEKLLSIGEDFRNNLNQLTESIHKLAGKEFNINSPAQVAGVLFDDLGLPSNRKRSVIENMQNLFQPMLMVLLNIFMTMVNFILSIIKLLLQQDVFLHQTQIYKTLVFVMKKGA